MFAKPTINDHLAQVYARIEEGKTALLAEIMQITFKATNAGSLDSTRTVIVITEVAKKVFEEFVSKILGELQRSIEQTDLEPDELRNLTYARLEEFRAIVVSIVKGRFENSRTARLAPHDLPELRERLNFLTRNFDIGFFQAARPFTMVTHNNNSVSVGTAIGSQVGGASSTQTINLAINAQAALAAVADLERTLKSSGLQSELLNDIQNDLESIRSQLNKRRPSVGVLKALGGSLKSVIEGVAAGILTPPALVSAAALWATLGMS